MNRAVKQQHCSPLVLLSKLPEMRRILATDVEAAYYGDPAATCFGEIISCYPAIRAISNYRIAMNC